jgi:hypothetical protein
MSSKRVDFYETYYKNVSPSTFKVKKEDDKIVIEDINKKYPKNFKPKDVKQYPVNQEAFKKGGKINNDDVIYTKEFKNWFGDWEKVSNNIKKLVDNGKIGEFDYESRLPIIRDPKDSAKDISNPLYDGVSKVMRGRMPEIVYHGTSSFNEFTVFRRSGFGGFYFSNDYEVARSYGTNIFKVYLDIKNPFVYDFRTCQSFDEVQTTIAQIDYGLKEARESGKDRKINRYGTEYILSKDCDGIIFLNINDVENQEYGNELDDEEYEEWNRKYCSTVYIVYKSEQIKLANGKNTKFDPNNPDVRFKKGGQTKSWKNKYNKKYGYPANESHSIKEISKDTGVSVKGLKAIYKKGVGARKTNPQSVRSVSDGKKRGGKSLRGKMGAQQWAMARIYSAVMGGKAAKVDKKELKMKKGGALQKPKNEYGVMFNKGYDNVRLEFFIFKNKNTYIDGENIGYADSKLYLDDINVLNLYEFTLFPQYDTEEARREIIYFIKDKMKMHTGKNKLMINNTIQ